MSPIHFHRSHRAAGIAVAFAAVLASSPAVAAVSPQDAAHLLARAEAAGTIPVIVRLAVPYEREGTLRDAIRVGAQRQAIAAAQDRLVASLRGQSARTFARFQFVPYLALEVDAGALRALVGSPEAVSIVEDVPGELLLNESIPLIGGDDAHAAGLTGAGQTIAILDTGVAGTHPFLNGSVVSEACYSGFGSSYVTTCPNSQGSMVGPGAGVPCDINAGCWHGTHVAGIAAGRGGPGFDGVARDATLISIQVASIPLSGGQPSFTLPLKVFRSHAIQGLERVYQLVTGAGMDVASVNMSFAFDELPEVSCDGDLLKPIVDDLLDVGVASVAGSGNDGNAGGLRSPACISTVVSVGATTNTDQVPSFSNSAPSLDLLAPGAPILSSLPPPLGQGPYTCTGGQYGPCVGTSMASPHVAGAWAVMKEANPTATVAEVFTLLVGAGVPVLDPRNNLVRPRLHLGAALDLCSPPPQGDWVVEESCTFYGGADVAGDLIVEDPATLTIAPGAVLDVDFATQHILVRDGARVIVKVGGKID